MEDKALQVFSFESQTVRVVTVEGEPWWVAKDVCDILGYANSRDAVETHCKHSGKHTVANRDGITRNPETTIIPESDMYRLIIRSHLPEAERFEVWVMEEVLPSIRKHGAYLTPVTLENALADPRSIAQILYKLADEREAKSRALAALEEARENNEILETALNSALQWRTVMQYNTERGMGWGMKECKAVGKELSAYCRANSVEIRKCLTNDDRFTVVNSYPLSAWEAFQESGQLPLAAGCGIQGEKLRDDACYGERSAGNQRPRAPTA